MRLHQVLLVHVGISDLVAFSVILVIFSIIKF